MWLFQLYVQAFKPSIIIPLQAQGLPGLDTLGDQPHIVISEKWVGPNIGYACHPFVWRKKRRGRVHPPMPGSNTNWMNLGYLSHMRTMLIWPTLWTDMKSGTLCSLSLNEWDPTDEVLFSGPAIAHSPATAREASSPFSCGSEWPLSADLWTGLH